MTDRHEENLDDYLKPTFYIDSDSPEILEFVKIHMKDDTPKEKAISLFQAVRDIFWYDPYDFVLKPNELRASVCVTKRTGVCITKAIVLAAVLRGAGIPSRVAFANVKNHLSTKRLKSIMKTDIFYYHGYTELFLNGQWFKVTPTFNKELCEKVGILPMEFDGESDCVFHPYDAEGKKHMEYLKFHGSFAEYPYDMIAKELMRIYPDMYPADGTVLEGNFMEEAEKIDF